jgi:hypothetical protein
MIVTNEMKAKILADYNAMKTSGERAAFARRLKKAGLPCPVAGGPKHSKQDAMIAALLAMGAEKPAATAPASDKGAEKKAA